MKGLEARAAVDAVVGLAELFLRNAPFLKISVRHIHRALNPARRALT
jgi:hypothetical protein